MHTEVLKTCGFTKAGLFGLMLGILSAILGGTVSAVTFSDQNTSCAGSVTMTSPREVRCGTTLLSPECVGQQTLVVDAQRKINCVTSAPGAPTNVTATPGNSQATVTFLAPASDGGAAINGYTVTSIPSGGTDSNAGSPALSHIITGLNHTTAYTFTVTATNSVGIGAASVRSNAVTPNQAKVSQTIGGINIPSATIWVGGFTPASATATSGLAVSFSSTTPGVCTVSGSMVTGIAAGTCTIAADQAGNASYSAAPRVTQSITVTGSGSIPPVTQPTAGPPDCKLIITAGFSIGTITLIANCDAGPPPTSYSWSANGCKSNEPSCAVATPSTTTTYSVIGINGPDSSPKAEETYEITLTPPTCTLSANPPNIAPGGESILTASCPGATSYKWAGGTCELNTTNTCTVSLPSGEQVYTVAGINAAGQGTVASATVKVAPPTCTLSAEPPNIAPNGTSILKASCPGAISYKWTGGTCADITTKAMVATAISDTKVTVASVAEMLVGDQVTIAGNPGVLTITQIVGNQLTFTPATTAVTAIDAVVVVTKPAICSVSLAAGSQSYTVAGSNTAGTGAEASATVKVTPPSCKLTAKPTSIAPNGISILTAECTPAATQYSWTGGTCAGNATDTCTVSLATGNQSYTVTGSNGGLTGNASPPVTVAVQTQCAQKNTIIPFRWGIDFGFPFQTPMSNGESVSFEFTTGDAGVMNNMVKEMSSRGQLVPTFIHISDQPCDFTYPPLIANEFIDPSNWDGCSNAGLIFTVNYIVEEIDSKTPKYCSLRPHKKYYVNVRNEKFGEPGVDTCQAGVSCAFLFNML